MKSMAEIFRSYAEFDSAGRHVNGTDKESNHHYGNAYESLFAQGDANLCPYPLHSDRRSCNKCGSDTYHFADCPDSKVTRHSVKLVMEVGVADGSCLLAWRDIFPNATIVGVDIHPSDRAHGERLEFHLGDQRVRRHCEAAAAGRQFDLIVEDATHHIGDTLLTLYWLWPFVRPGGLYVVEEWEGVSGDRDIIRAMWPATLIVGTSGPHIDDEPLVVFRKPK